VSTRWTLRRRLLATVLGLLAVVATVMGVASTLALRASLVAQMDDRLRSASQRAVHAPERSTSGTTGTTGTGSAAAAPGTSPTPRGSRVRARRSAQRTWWSPAA